MPPRSTRRGEVVVLTTVSEDGLPYHAFLSDDEVAFREDGRVAISLAAGSLSRRNLEAGRGATLLRSGNAAFVTSWIVRRGRMRRLESDPERRLVPLAVQREVVAEPLHGEAGRLSSGLRYERREGPAERRRRDAAARELRA